MMAAAIERLLLKRRHKYFNRGHPPTIVCNCWVSAGERVHSMFMQVSDDVLMKRYDAFLLLSFGGPEGPDDVMPFLRNVTRERNVPDERLQSVADHYNHFDGVSPLNRRLLVAIQEGFTARGLDLPTYWGNRNWHPMLKDTVAEMAVQGVRRAITLVTSAYSSYSGCRQYIQDIENARRSVGEFAPVIDKIPPFWAHPMFLRANEQQVLVALEELGDYDGASTFIIFTAHSIPETMATNCDYEHQLRSIAGQLAAEIGTVNYALAYQSRSGPPSQPWLQPDVCDVIRHATVRGARRFLIHPVGFVADHMEVLYDLDVEARQLCEELGVEMVRSSTVGTHKDFVNMICDLVQGYVEGTEELIPCPTTCCPSGQ
jgi:protoporphyrin/coproporphyrin ferrochelatase